MAERALNVGLDTILFRAASAEDVEKMVACRLTDADVGPADPRMTAYFNGQHHPQEARMPRTGHLALVEGTVIGYVAGHLTTRHECEGEVQYLFVAPAYRRRGVGTALLRLMAVWFQGHSCTRVCVCVDADSPSALPFYGSLGAFPLSPVRKYWYVWQDIGVLMTKPQA